MPPLPIADCTRYRPPMNFGGILTSLAGLHPPPGNRPQPGRGSRGGRLLQAGADQSLLVLPGRRVRQARSPSRQPGRRGPLRRVRARRRTDGCVRALDQPLGDHVSAAACWSYPQPTTGCGSSRREESSAGHPTLERSRLAGGRPGAPAAPRPRGAGVRRSASSSCGARRGLAGVPASILLRSGLVHEETLGRGAEPRPGCRGRAAGRRLVDRQRAGLWACSSTVRRCRCGWSSARSRSTPACLVRWTRRTWRLAHSAPTRVEVRAFVRARHQRGPVTGSLNQASPSGLDARRPPPATVVCRTAGHGPRPRACALRHRRLGVTSGWEDDPDGRQRAPPL